MKDRQPNSKKPKFTTPQTSTSMEELNPKKPTITTPQTSTSMEEQQINPKKPTITTPQTSTSMKDPQPNSKKPKFTTPQTSTSMEEQQLNPKKPTITTPQTSMEKPEITPVEPIITVNRLSSRQLNILSILNKEWYTRDSMSRQEVLVSNIWAVTPRRVIERFPNFRSIILVNPIPMGLNPTVDTFRFWHTADLQSHKILESLALRQMSITDDDLKTILTDYPKLNALTLISCTGFSLKGIEAVAANCRNLVRLIVRSCNFRDSDSKGDLLTTLHAESLVSLEMPGIEGVNSNIGDPGRLYKIIKSAARLEHLGVVVNMKGQQPSTKAAYENLSRQLKESRKLESLSLGCLEDCLLSVPSCYIHAFQPIAAQLVSLNIRNFKSAHKKDQTGLIKNCINLRTLQACSFEMDDVGLETIGRCCTKLVRVKLLDRLDRSGLTEKGLKNLAIGCPLLKSLSICVQRMTCECLAFFSQHKRNVECFKLYVEDMSFYIPGGNNADILDQGFASLLGVCQKLKKLRASNVSNELFSSIAGKNLEVLIVSVAAGGKTPNLRGLARSCPRLEKLGIQGCWFPSLPRDVFLKKAFKCMWLKSYGGCTNLGECRKGLTDWPDVNLHVVRSMGQHDLAKVILVYIYKTRVAGKAFFP